MIDINRDYRIKDHLLNLKILHELEKKAMLNNDPYSFDFYYRNFNENLEAIDKLYKTK
jgi:hypothetical protein